MSKQTPEAIQEWIIDQICELTDLEASEIHPEEPFASYGLDSMSTVTLVGDLEEWLGLRLAATLLWDYPTIDALSVYLAELSAD
ncbi:acyl carrier protein [Tumebacillus flagellatus]|uniref:Carrier domain-containing protein n=1 Tax=Tumebacillus flagellatus TaxID=1157490 RepID=A0A074LQ04_9BACL|nr:acyl carrier protein [Tumebacillus flagellatus]KEO82565.1 hypothetical protein EL26_14355 [Tumebacillus flagellatus]